MTQFIFGSAESLMKAIARVATFVPLRFLFEGTVLPTNMYLQQIAINFGQLPLCVSLQKCLCSGVDHNFVA